MMWIYWLLLAGTVSLYAVCVLQYKKKHDIMSSINIDNCNLKSYFIIVSIMMIAVIGLREKHIGIDTFSYYNSYQRMELLNFDYLLNPVLKEEGTERGYVFLQILFNKLHVPFTGFNLIYAIFNVSVITLLIYKSSKKPWLSYFLYICYEFFLLDMTMMRQTTAMSIVILAIMYDNNKTVLDFLKFALIVYAASLIHSSAIICIPLWFIFKIPYNTTTIIIALIAIISSYIFRGALMNIVGQIASEVSNKYDYAVFEEGNAGQKLYYMIIATVIMGTYLKIPLQKKDNLKMHYLLVLMLIIFPAVQSGGAIMRIYFYLYIYMIIYIPNMISYIDIRKDRIVYYVIIALYIIVGLYLYNDALLRDTYIVPYKFFWQ